MLKSSSTKLFGITAGAALVTLGVVGATLAQAAPGAEADSTMSTGVTVTQTTAARQPLVPMAEPSIKGPAPLPVEEQGLPG
jgi:hypothetical protein